MSVKIWILFGGAFFFPRLAWAADSSPPSPITDLFASSGPAAGSIALDWSAPTDDSNGGALVGGFYRIDFASETPHFYSSSTFKLEFGTSTAPGERQALVIGGLTGNATYSARVVSGDDSLNFSGLSNGATALTLAYPPGSPSHSGQDDSTIFWSWAVSTANAAGTEFLASDNFGNSGWVPGGSFWSSPGKTANAPYVVTIRSRNADGLESTEVSTQAYTAIDTPSDVEFDLLGSSSMTARAVGNFPNLQSGLSGVFIANLGTGQNSGWIQTTTASFTGLTPNTLYSMSAKARNAEGDETFPVIDFTATKAPDPEFGDLTLTPDSSTQITMTVAPIPNAFILATGYEIEHVAGAGGTGSGKRTGNYSFVNSNLLPNTQYSYRFAYFNMFDERTVSGPVKSIFTLPIPAAPLAYSTAGVNLLQANWGTGGNPLLTTPYRVEATTDAYATIAASSLTFNTHALFADLSPLTTYELRVQALNQDGALAAAADLGPLTLSRRPIAPTHAAQSQSSLSWSWTADPVNPPGTEFYAEDESGNTGWVPDNTAFVSPGKTANTLYTLGVQTRNSFGLESVPVTTGAYTAVESAAGVAFDSIGISSVRVRAAGTFSNISSALSGILLENLTAGASSGWIQTLEWDSVSLASNTYYAFAARSRNGDADETPTVFETRATSLYPPSPPDIDLSADSTGQITVSVTPPNNPSLGATGCEIDAVLGAGGDDSGKLAAVYAYSDGVLASNTRYGYRARYRNADDLASAWGPAVYRYTLARPPLAAPYSGAGTDAVRANWGTNANPGDTAYLVEVSTDAFLTIAGSSLTTNGYGIMTGLAPDTVFSGRVRAINGDGVETAIVPLASFETADIPVAPAHTANSSHTVSWTWSAGPGNPGGTEYFAEDETGNSGWIAGLTAWVSDAKAENTLYALGVKARTSGGLESRFVATAAYTAITPPASLIFDMVGPSSVTVRATGTFANLGQGISGVFLANNTAGDSSGWTTALAHDSLSLSSNTIYAFGATARNGDGDTSVETTASTTTLLHPPGDGDLALVAVSSTRITASVPAPPNPSLGWTGAEFLNTQGAGGNGSGELTGLYSFDDTGLSPNTLYGYRVRYFNGDRVETAYAAEALRYTIGAVPAPLGYSAKTTVNLRAAWGANGNPPGTLYLVECTTDAFATLTASSATYNTSALFSDLLPDTTYRMRVASINHDAVPSGAAELGTVATLAEPPGNPGHLTNSTYSVTWSWEPNGNAADTEYFAQDDNKLSGWLPGALSWTGIEKAPNAQYTLFVLARNRDQIPTTIESTQAYTSIEIPASVAFDMVGISSISVSALGPMTNLAAGLSALRIFNDTAADASNWMKTRSWDSLSLSSNTAYTFTSRGRNFEGDETPVSASFTTTTLLNPPAAGTLSLAADTSSQLTLTAAPPPNPSLGGTGVEFSSLPGPGANGSGDLVGTYSFSDSGLAHNTEYAYRIRYFNADGVPTDYGPSASAFTLAAQPGFPGFAGATDASFVVSWGVNGNKPGIEYAAEVSTDAFASLSGSSRTRNTDALFPGLAPNTTYEARVTAYNDSGEPSPYSFAAASATVARVPAASTITLVGGGSVFLAWDANGNPPGSIYEAQASTSADFSPVAASSVTRHLDAEVSGLSVLTTYYLRVRTNAFNGAFSAFASPGSTRTLSDYLSPTSITDLLVLPGSAEGRIALTWSAPGDDAEGGTVDQYLIRYSPTPILDDGDFADAPLVSAPPVPREAGGAESFEIAGLIPGTTYYVRIKSLDEAANPSEPSNTANAASWAQFDVTPPSAAADLALIGVSSSSLEVRWTASGDDGDSGNASSYELRYSAIGPIETDLKFDAAAPAAAPAPSAPGSAESALISGLQEAVTYFIAVRAVDERGNRAAISNILNGVTLNFAPPAVPAWAAEPFSAAGGTLELDWLDNPETDLGGYYLGRSTASGGPYLTVATAAASASRAEDPGLADGVTYFFVLRAFDTGGLLSGLSAELSTSTFDSVAPEAPAGFKTALLDDGRTALSWSPVGHDSDGGMLADLLEYRVYRAASLGGSYALAAAVPSEGPWAWTEPSPLAPGYYKVVAADTRGNESPGALVASPDLSLRASAADGSAVLRVPSVVSGALYKGSNAFSEDIRLSVNRTPAGEGGRVLWAGSVDPVRAESLVSAAATFAFPKVRAELLFKVPGLGTASAGSNDLSVFRHDGAGWIKIGGEVDPGAGTVSVETARLGRFEVRRSARAASFGLLQIVPQKIFTPNGDGVNDAVEFFFDNPSDAVFAQAQIYDLTGAAVSDMKPGTTGTSYVWDGTGPGGGVVPGGIYIYQFQAGGRTINGTVVVAK